MQDQGMKTEDGIAMLRKVRGYSSRLPHTEEIVDGFGHTTLKVKGKSYVIMGEGHDGGDPGLSIKADKESQQMLISQGPYTRTAYIGQHGWVSIRAREVADWNEVGQLIEEAYLRAAPKKLVQEYVRREPS